MDVTIVCQSYSATNWQQEVCHFKNALKSPFYYTADVDLDVDLTSRILCG